MRFNRLVARVPVSGQKISVLPLCASPASCPIHPLMESRVQTVPGKVQKKVLQEHTVEMASDSGEGAQKELDRWSGLANIASKGSSPYRCAPQGTASEPELHSYWQGLHVFFRTGKGGEGGIAPALMAPFQDSTLLETIFPLWMPDAKTWAENGQEPSYGLSEAAVLLQNAFSAFAPEAEEAPLLKRHLPRLLRIIRHLAQGVGPLAAEQLWKESAEELQKELQLKGVEALMLTGELNQLRRALPAGGAFIPFSPYTSLHLLSSLLEYEGAYRSARLTALAERHIPQLQEMLAVEKEKQPQAKEGVDVKALAEVPPGEEGSSARFSRLYNALDTLQAYLRAEKKSKNYLFAQEGIEEQAGVDLARWFAHCDLCRTSVGQLFESVRSGFEGSMSAMASFWAALRIARLEYENRYQPALHDEFFAAFDWRAFSEEEMALCPSALLLIPDSVLLGPGLSAFSELLQANLAIKVVSFPDRHSALSRRAYALEPVALALAHRNAFVLQGSAVSPGALCAGLQKGLRAAAPALFHLLGMEGSAQEAYLNALAAVEGRAFPGLVYDPLGGPQWGSRFTLIQNPDSGQDWPVHTIPMQVDAERKLEKVAFTFVDFIGSLKGHEPHFKIVPPAFWTPSLIPVADYLQLAAPERAGEVPFIWVLDRERQLQKAAVAWPLVEKAMQRRDFWQYLQEIAGVRSFHALRAAEQLAVERESDFEQRVQRLQGEHQNELQAAKDAAAREAMENLATVLLDLDAAPPSVATREATPAAQKSAAPESMAEPAAEVSAPPAAVPPKAAPAAGPIEIAAWIDTPLCTSCSECVDSEPGIFHYNEDKQAFIANPRGGSFGDLVKAAERCPVSIIHPGTPWDKDDPDLSELLERAKPFA